MADALDHLTFSLIRAYHCGMLTYLSGGTRRYGEEPIRVYGRPYWEFQAVLAGAIAPAFPDGPAPLAERTLWVFPPGLEHGWTGRPDETAEIVVFHFDSVAEPAASFIRRSGHLQAALGADAMERVAAVAAESARIRAEGDPLAALRFDSGCLALTIAALEALGPARTAPLLDRAEMAAANAEAWYSEHMAAAPPLARIARAANCSESHLRRLYREARGASPSDAFLRLRMVRARELLAWGSLAIKEIAALCGYEEQSCFSRAFRRAEGTTAREYRSRFKDVGRRP